MTSQLNETLQSLYDAVGYKSEGSLVLQQIANKDMRYAKDLKINITNSLKYENLTEKESALLALSVAINEKSKDLIESLAELAKEKGASEEEILETYSCVSLLNVNNVFYRFRHFNKKEFYSTTPAGIKMTIMGNPIMGKEFFELMSLAISALNGCKMCVNAHEDSLMKLGTSQARVYDAIRLAANFKGLTVFFN